MEMLSVFLPGDSKMGRHTYNPTNSDENNIIRIAPWGHGTLSCSSMGLYSTFRRTERSMFPCSSTVRFGIYKDDMIRCLNQNVSKVFSVQDVPHCLNSASLRLFAVLRLISSFCDFNVSMVHTEIDKFA